MISNKFLKIIILSLSTVIFSSCLSDFKSVDDTYLEINKAKIIEHLQKNKYPIDKIDNEGNYYVILNANTNDKPKDIDSVFVSHGIYTLDDKLIDSSKAPVAINYALRTGLYAKALQLLREKETGIFYFSGSSKSLLQIPANTPYYAKFYINSLINEKSKIQKYFLSNFDKSITDKSLSAYELKSGVYLIKTKLNEVEVAPKDGDTTKVLYKGRFLNNTIFDSYTASDSLGLKNAPVFLIASDSTKVNHINGFRLALNNLKQGESGIVIMNSSQAYGALGSKDANGTTVIPIFSPLVFEIEVIKITKGK